MTRLVIPKVGHMVGANLGKQFIAQLFGVLAGALLAVPAYFVLVPDVSVLGGDKFPAPSALVWMGVAKVAQGLSTLPRSAVMRWRLPCRCGDNHHCREDLPKIKPYTPSPTALGIAMTIPAYTSFAMFLGALIAWILEKKAAKVNDMYTIATASGLIGGESIMGVFIAALIAFGVLWPYDPSHQFSASQE
ncbi:MAG: OPT/YSL family transporter [bacterium]|nr:OPT/YSL family transporter [bacterium]